MYSPFPASCPFRVALNSRPVPPHQTQHAVFPHWAFRSSSPQGMRVSLLALRKSPRWSSRILLCVSSLPSSASRLFKQVCFPLRTLQPAPVPDDAFSCREIKLYRTRGLNTVVDQREELPFLPPCGVMDSDSTGKTPSALCPPQEAGFTLNFTIWRWD